MDEGDFNNDGSHELTHGGQSLAQIENFERVELSDDEKVDPDDPEKGKISGMNNLLVMIGKINFDTKYQNIIDIKF